MCSDQYHVIDRAIMTFSSDSNVLTREHKNYTDVDTLACRVILSTKSMTSQGSTCTCLSVGKTVRQVTSNWHSTIVVAQQKT